MKVANNNEENETNEKYADSVDYTIKRAVAIAEQLLPTDEEASDVLCSPRNVWPGVNNGTHSLYHSSYFSKATE